ncbi:hypothetical protein C3V39_06095 [Prevotella sp. oral taxon 820]|nr:hypothetical protein C3V39_06095 [Prevotella sp. oral taxon 820]
MGETTKMRKTVFPPWGKNHLASFFIHTVLQLFCGIYVPRVLPADGFHGNVSTYIFDDERKISSLQAIDIINNI